MNPAKLRRNFAVVFAAALCIAIPCHAQKRRSVGTRSPGDQFTIEKITGQVLDANLRPAAGAEVTVRAENTIVATARTDDSGTFAVAGLRGGMHQVDSPTTSALCRFWAPSTAPPCAIDQLAIIEDGAIVRGQAGPQFRQDFLHDAKAVAAAGLNPQRRVMVPFILLTPIGYFIRRRVVARSLSLAPLWLYLACALVYLIGEAAILASVPAP